MADDGAASSLIGVDDLTPFADVDKVKAQAMIDDAIARAKLAAPCIIDPTFEHRDVVKSILRGALLRWIEAGSGAVTTHSTGTGPFANSTTIDNRQQRRGMFWPSEIDDLRSLCETTKKQAYSIDTAPPLGGGHLLWCARSFGANYCSCGADINNGTPLYEDAP